MSMTFWAGSQHPTAAQLITLRAQKIAASTINELKIMLLYFKGIITTKDEATMALEGDKDAAAAPWAGSYQPTTAQIVALGAQVLDESTVNDIKAAIKYSEDKSTSKTWLTTTFGAILPQVAALSVAGITNGHGYVTGDVVSLTVTFNAPVVKSGGGTPQIALTLGSHTRQLAYASGSGTTALVFSYTVVLGDKAEAGDVAVASAIVLNSGLLKDLAGNAIGLGITPPATSTVTANKAPQITGVAGITNGHAYVTGNVISISITWDEAVTKTGTPRIAVHIGSNTRQFNYASGTGTVTLVFSYTAVSGDAAIATEFVVDSPIDLNGGTLKDADGNNAAVAFTPPTTTTVTVN